MFTLDDFDFELPEELIAQCPASARTGSRLLCPTYHGTPPVLSIQDHLFNQLPQLITPGDLLVINDTKVINARLYGKKDTGGLIEVLIERITSPTHAIAKIRSSKAPKAGSTLTLEEAFNVSVTGRTGDNDEFFSLELCKKHEHDNLFDLLDQYGHLPLPPYITHSANQDDLKRYQTVFAENAGAVAAPTAGLHFDTPLMQSLSLKGVLFAKVTLHVGAGTFQPVREQDISLHKMHSERYYIPPETVSTIQATKNKGNKVIAVGTTSMRALEAASQHGTLEPGHGETDIFITPGYRFNVVDRLITNFHLPKSTLLMLVSAFSGRDTIRKIYQHAIEHQYRFFSYGDAMLLDRQITD